MFGALFAGAKWSNGTLVPKLALDLEGGTQLILQPVTRGNQQITDQDITQAIDIMRQRVDASGVSEAQITSQGSGQNRNIVVALPGTPSKETLDLVRQSAQMFFRPVLKIGAPAAGTPDKAAANLGTPANNSDPAWLTQDVLDTFATLDCTDPKNLSGTGNQSGDPAKPLVTCSKDGTTKYVLGPVDVYGKDLSSANSGLKTTQTGQLTNEWVVNLKLNASGTTAFRDASTRLVDLTSPRNQFAIVLDGLVISAPRMDSIIPNGQAEISGSFTRESAATLARQLNFGALPLTFTVQSEQQISATLGSEQLQRGILAGLIGLALVVVYSIFQYRALGFVTILSLAVAAGATYALIGLLSWTQGYRLSLPGVAGLIVAIGITADSFIVYFERVRDELRDGRTLPAAVSQGWSRAKRTILASDTVNFLAALVLYFLAVGGVRGFAFTLGLTTIVDLAVVFMLTHPVLALLAKTRFFAEGHRFSGLDPSALGARTRYVGRGRVVGPDEPAEGGEPERRLTIAERRAAANAGSGSTEGKDA
ncbi:protein translocase subunit SecD [Isoptericola sp. b441]|uniref:Protein translocase subunit SecD n=2 Tax=Actinotalea lenta TaxID=3064654 RepID=A0ABT9DEW0_9CELL|nr:MULTISPECIES: protein translocase subunit SecD [unclassified Isoptericola]MDO8107817.1 protein translocase subunit SecD [Isoptericola sp. b441]MDO8120512.1 protein translocase subunit SecD [Isoptericola sp. b490]